MSGHFASVRSCLFCDATIARELLHNPGRPSWSVTYVWVDQLSGDDGGTYDHCPVTADHQHQPAHAADVEAQQRAEER